MFDYGITDTELIVEGAPPSQSVFLETTVEIFEPQAGEDIVNPSVIAQIEGGGDVVNITDPFRNVKFGDARNNYPGAETVTLLDDSFVGFFDASRIPNDVEFGYQARRAYNNGEITLADQLAFSYAIINDTSVGQLPGEVNVPITISFTPDNFDSAKVSAGTIPIQREGGTFDPTEVFESGCSLSTQSITGSGTTTATYELQNANENDAASVTVEVLVDGQRAGTDQGTIQPSSTTTFAFDIPLSAPGDYNISYDIVNVEKA